jgi:murein DD-endopeptidase MepM/ murein hydrolase activator NlpD
LRWYNSRVSRALRFLLVSAAVALLAPAAASAYSWPLRPFYQQHAIRGYFNDPRLSGDETGFHFGVDISAPDGTPVYAIEGGRAQVRGLTVSVFPKRGGHQFAYWHIVPAVRARQRVRQHQVIGRIAPGAEHVHLGEYRDGTYVNPLRLGGLAPYIDDTVPQIPKLTFYSFGNPVAPENLSGFVDVTIDAYDPSPLPGPPDEWAQARLSPAFVRWRIVEGPNTVRQWETAVDFRRFLLPIALFNFVYAPGTYQNRPDRPGRYEYYLAHALDTGLLPNGSYVLQVEALDEQENLGKASFPFTILNGA